MQKWCCYGYTGVMPGTGEQHVVYAAWGNCNTARFATLRPVFSNKFISTLHSSELSGHRPLAMPCICAADQRGQYSSKSVTCVLATLMSLEPDMQLL